MQQSWFQRLAPILEWSYITRSQIPLYALIAAWLGHYSWWLIPVYWLDAGERVVSLEQFYQLTPIIAMTLVATTAVLLLGEMLRRKHLEPTWYQHLTANFYGLSLVWGGYITGGLSFAAGVVLMGAPMIGFLILQRHVVLIAFAISFTALLACNLASAWGLLPYAPFVVLPQSTTDAQLWTLSHLMIAAPHLLFELVFSAVVVGQWRIRETTALRQSLTDGLTGLHNRRSLLKQLVHELARAKRSNTQLSLLLFDLDHFKQINDRHGHPIGDQVLAETARLLTEEIRAGDTLGRFGGEEFLLLLPRTDITKAKQIAERCRTRLASARVCNEHGDRIAVSASFGVAWIDAGARCNETTLIADADAALYRAKEHGRNCVELANGPSTLSAAFEDQDQQRHLPAPRLHIDWKKFATLTSVRAILTSILEWTPVNKARMVNALTLYIISSVYLWITLLNYGDNPEDLLGADTVSLYFKVAPLLFGVTILLLLIGARVNQHNANARWYITLSANLLALSLVWIGYGVGVLSMPTGILMLCTPIVGFLLFERWQILQPLLTAQALVVLIAFYSANGTLEYAALFARDTTLWQPHSQFFVISYYLASSLMGIIALVLMDHILSRWRTREAEIRALSITDMLTHAHNRRSILDLLGKAREQTARHRQALTVVLIDLDHFKRINDSWGHPMGDRVLKQTAHVLQNCLRDTDVLGRFGGEEFLIVLPATDLAGAKIFAERCREKIQALALHSDTSDTVPITASFGICCSPPDHVLTVTQLIKLADDALYQAKAQGRNCVVSADDQRDSLPVFA